MRRSPNTRSARHGPPRHHRQPRPHPGGGPHLVCNARGYALTSLQEIATALDVTKAALYFYFPAKAQLLTSLADPLLDGAQGVLDAYTDGPLTASAQQEVIYALTDLLLAHRRVVAWLARDLTALAQPEIGDRIAGHAAHVQRLLAGDDASLAGQVRVAAAVGALLGPLVALDTQALNALRDTLVAAALAPLSAE